RRRQSKTRLAHERALAPGCSTRFVREPRAAPGGGGRWAVGLERLDPPDNNLPSCLSVGTSPPRNTDWAARAFASASVLRRHARLSRRRAAWSQVTDGGAAGFAAPPAGPAHRGREHRQAPARGGQPRPERPGPGGGVPHRVPFPSVSNSVRATGGSPPHSGGLGQLYLTPELQGPRARRPQACQESAWRPDRINGFQEGPGSGGGAFLGR